MLLQPGNQSVNIYEIAVDALQMHHIRLFFQKNAKGFARRKVAATVSEPGEPREQAVRPSIQITAKAVDTRRIRIRSAPIQDNRISAICKQRGVQRLRYFSGTSNAIHTVDLQNLHEFTSYQASPRTEGDIFPLGA